MTERKVIDIFTREEILTPEEHQRQIDLHLDALKLLGVTALELLQGTQVEYRWKEG